MSRRGSKSEVHQLCTFEAQGAAQLHCRLAKLSPPRFARRLAEPIQLSTSLIGIQKS